MDNIQEQNMNRRAKATMNRDKALHLNKDWGVGANQVRYREDGTWYASLKRFPAALFDAHGYVFFANDEELRNSPFLRIGKQISVPHGGISAIPSYVRVVAPDALPNLNEDMIDVDIHASAATEGNRRLVMHLRRERNQSIVRRKKKLARSLDCEICGFAFSRVYGRDASDYCEVHHLLPLSDVDGITKTRMKDLAILCANCHRVVHLQNPPYALEEVKAMLASNGLRSA